jgi:hypothetical protein
MPFDAFLLHHIFLFAKNASHFFYRKQKNVVYLFALCEMVAKTFFYYFKKYISKVKIAIITIVKKQLKKTFFVVDKLYQKWYT